MSKHSDQDQELAHEMVVEMLAHQFAYPVKWIDTQDVLLDRQKTERLIEIGPSDTLTVMAKRTIKSKYEAQDATLSRRRQLLSGDTDLAEIYYEVDPQPAPAEQSSGNGDSTNDSPPPYSSEPSSSEGPKPSPTPGRTKAARSSMKKPDAPISAQEILVGIIAQKLKKASGDITATSTIKSLASGRSTLENEIIGDLVNEFGTVPDRAEEVAIQDLGKILQSSFGERLGKQTSRMVEQLLASKMPGGFSTNSARKYLDSRWGLGEGRQDSCLMAAVVSAPAVRLPTEQAAHQFFDDIAAKHIAAAGLSSLQENDDDDGDALTAAVDPEALRKLKEEQNEIARKKLELYAEQLQIDLQAGLKSYAVAQNTINELEAQLDLWTREHGDVYAAGIKPMVDNRKVRVYDSWWNWALQDAFTLFHELTTGTLKADNRDLASRTFRIINRSTPKLVEVLKFMVTICQNEDGNTYKAAEGVIEALIAECQSSMGQPPVFRNFASSMAPQTIIADDGKISITEVPRIRDDEEASIFVVKRKGPSGWLPDEESTSTYLECFGESSNRGIDFEHRVVLLTGAGSGSIGSELLRGLLSGGAKVVVTTSSFSLEVTRFYQNIYTTYGATGSQLVVVPFNQGSQQDIDALLSYIYDTSKGGLGWDLDAVIPFAAISEKGREIDGVDSKSQLAHRIMLTNTVQMIGAIKRFKVKYGSDTRPAQVILPLSPNHGNFGGDGLYAESKLALESLFDKWKSESWSNYLSICGASIGWTRGTGLMSGNDIVAEEIEKLGVRTFSQQEMATSILALMAYPIVEICQTQPLYADLNGGLGKVPNLPDVLSQIRKSIIKTADIRRALAQEALLDGNPDESLDAEDEIDARANISLGFPDLPTSADLQPLAHLKGMVDLERVVVITGFSELGPYGNARTRWEMEAYGKFSLEGCVEMAWIMGLIRYSSAGTNGSKSYSGWLDAKTNERVEEWDIKRRYEKHILENSGIRLVDPELWDGYDPHKKQAFQEVVVEQNLKSFEASKETAEAFRREHGEKVDILEVPESSGNTFTVRIKKGAVLMIPKALDFGNDVAGQIPSGWNPRTYGITEEIIASVDRITLYVLICTIESLLSAGISDPYEIYQYVHTSQVGNCVGSGAGGIISLEKIHRARAMEKPASQDVLQETFNNTIAAWVNMLIMSSNGPIRTPVGACATAIESLDNAYDLIISGKAKLCLVGGVDDLQENTSYEFANMKATSNGALEHAAGRDPKEMSRPTASTRKGFMESQGCGMQVVCTARVALDMGLPIYGIVAFTGTSSDKIGRSVPAPGKGLMVHATEARAAFPSPFLDIKFRRRQLMSRLTLIKAYEDAEHQLLESEIEAMRSTDSTFDVDAYRAHRTTHINYEVTRQKADALDSLGNTFWKNHPEIAPMRGALATWGLTIDDLSVCSFHGTSTIMNERNECDVLQRELGHLGRAKGNRVLGVFQKYLTGHPKGAAGAWMMNGGLQILQTGLVPGNRNADNIDSELEKFDYIAFPNKAIQTTGVKAFSVFSFGFGQKGAQAIIVHPKYLFATLEGDEFELYKGKLTKRQRTALRTFNKGFLENRLFVAKDKAPFAGEKEMDAMLNPMARLEVKKDGNLLG